MRGNYKELRELGELRPPPRWGGWGVRELKELGATEVSSLSSPLRGSATSVPVVPPFPSFPRFCVRIGTAMEGTRPELLKVPPTRSNLLRLREELKQAREGYDLLQRKREVLVRELLEMIDDAEAVEREARIRFQTAYEVLQEARMSMGIDRLRWISLAQGGEVNARVTLRGVMGVAVPIVQARVTVLPLPYGLGDTSASLDEARERWREAVELLGHLAEAVTTAWRLAVELRRTQRRVSALEHNFIPQYEATLHAIAQVLEEQEREDFVHAKRVKVRHEGNFSESEGGGGVAGSSAARNILAPRVGEEEDRD